MDSLKDIEGDAKQILTPASAHDVYYAGKAIIRFKVSIHRQSMSEIFGMIR